MFLSNHRSLFLNIVFPTLTVLSQTVHMFAAGKLPLELHMCAGSDPDQGFPERQPPRINIPLLTTYIVSIVVNFGVPFRIRFYQLMRSNKAKDKYTSINMTDLTTSLAIIITLSSLVIFMLGQYRITPANLNKYPHYITTYWVQLLTPKLGTLIVMLTYFYRNKALRGTVWRAAKEDVFRWNWS